jgi:hypothetical protein
MAGLLVRKVDIVWSGLPGLPGFSQLYFEHQAGNATSIASAVKTFLTAIAGGSWTGLTAQIQPEQTIIDVTTGEPVSLEAATPQAAVNFTATGTPLPFQTQVLLRLATSQYNAGRRLRGRLYIPGAMVGMDTNGDLGPSWVTMYNSAAAALLTASNTNGKWAVYSRTHHAWASIDSATVWNQFAVQRRRRP